MRYENARDETLENTERYPMTYTHPNGQKTEYDLQQVRREDGKQPIYIISESEDNIGPGFDRTGTRDAVAEQSARAVIALNDPDVFPGAERKMRPNEIKLFQQRPDGDFERVDFREIGRDGRSNVDVEMEQNDPKAYKAYQQEQSNTQEGFLQFTETSRTKYTRQELEQTAGELHASAETHQQREQSQSQSLWDPAANRTAEQVEVNRQRSQGQTQQMNQQQEHDTQSPEW